MHILYKLAWAIRAILFKPFFAQFELPGYLGAPTFLLNTKRIHIGRRVRIFPGLRAECHGNGHIFVHNNVSIGQGFHVIASGELHIETGCLISGNVFVTDTDHTFSDVGIPVFDQPDRIYPTRIGKNCFIGIGARIQAGTTLGEGCIVGANSVVRGDFPAHSVIVGAPARVVKYFDPVSGQWNRC